MFAVEIYYSLALWSKIRYLLRIYKKKIRQKLSSLLLFNNFVFVGNTNHISLFPCIYAIIFDYLYQISFILTPKWVYYTSLLYYIKFVVILSVMQCSLLSLAVTVIVSRTFMNKLECGCGGNNHITIASTHLINGIFLIKTHYKYTIHIMITMRTAKMPPT